MFKRKVFKDVIINLKSYLIKEFNFLKASHPYSKYNNIFKKLHFQYLMFKVDKLLFFVFWRFFDEKDNIINNNILI